METLDLHGVFRDDRAIYRTVQQARVEEDPSNVGRILVHFK